MSSEFFDILEKNDEYILLLSKFASHKWKLVSSESTILIYHSHNLNDELHYQSAALDVYNAMLYILDHEDYQLNNRRKKRVFVTQQLQFNTLLMATYGLQ